MSVRRSLFVGCALAISIAGGLAGKARADGPGEFRAQFQDGECTTHLLCGRGLVEGYGHVTTTLDITGATFDSASGCLVNVTAVRNVALVDDASSTLTLDLSDGVICGNKGSATFIIGGATGAFAGLRILPGTVRVTLIAGPPADTAQYRGVLAP